MNSNTSKTEVKTVTKEFVTIGDASEILGVSIDTIRRWEKVGKLHSKRLDGKNRYFDIEHLNEFLDNKALSTSEVALLMGVSPSTVRRLENQGCFFSSRDHSGKRLYDKRSIQAYIDQGSNANSIAAKPTYAPQEQLSVAYAETETAPSIDSSSRPPLRERQSKLDITDKIKNFSRGLTGRTSPINFGMLQRAVVYGISGSLFIIVMLLVSMLTFPASTGDLFWGKPVQQRNVFVRVFKPFAERSLNLVEIVSPSTREKVLETATVPPSSMFNSDAERSGGVTPGSVPTKEQVTNLNSELVGGYKPGNKDGDLAVLPITGDKVKDKSLNGVDIADGTVQLANLSPALQALINGKNTSSGAQGPAGPQGAIGPAGPQGPQGPQGPTGGGVGNVIAGTGLLGGGSGTTVTLQVDAGDSTEVVSNGLEVRIASSGSTATTSSNSGLEITNQGLRLVGGCNAGQILKWSGSAWACSADNSGGGGGSLDVQTSDGASFVSGISNIQFGPVSSSTDQFTVTNLGSGQVRIQLGTNVLLTSNFAATLDPIYANATETPAAGDMTGSFAGGFFVASDAVALGTDTTGNYVATVGGSTGLTVSGSGSENASVSLALDVTTTGTTATLSSNSGLELGPDGLRLVGGCSNGQILKWNGTAWVCSADANAGSMAVQENDTTVSGAVGTIDFLGSDFDVSETPAGEINVAIDYANSGITRASQSATITGSWLFTDNAFSIRDNLDTTKQVAFQISGVSPSTTRTLTVPNNDGTIVTTGNLTDITSVGMLTSGTWQGSIIGTQYGGTGVNAATAANGTLLIGNGAGYSLTTLTQGSGISITNGVGSITIAAALGASIGSGEIELDAVTLGSQTVGNYVQSVVAGAGLTGDVAGEGGVASLAIGAGNGISVAADSIALSVQTNKGLEVDGSGLSLIDCAVNEILKYNGSNQWVCAADNGTGSAPSLQESYNNDVDGGNAVIELTATDGGLRVRDNLAPLGVNLFAVQNNDASVTYLAVSSSGINVTGSGTFSGVLTANGGLTLETGDAFTVNGEGFTDLTGAGLGMTGGLLNVQYGSTANTAVQGNTTITCASGSGNLSGGGNTVTLGVGGACSAITTNNAVSFSTSVTSPLLTNAGALTVSTTGVGNDLSLVSGGNIRMSANGSLLNCSTFDNGGVLTTDVSGNVVCQNDDGGAAGTITGSGTANRIPLYTGANSLGSSWIAQNVSTLELDATRNLSLLGGNLSVTGTGLFTGLLSVNGGITVEVGDTFTINGDGFTDLTGTGLLISGGALQTTLGTSVGSSEIEADAVALGTQTTGNYINNITAGNGIGVTGTAGEGWSPTMAVLYGSTANTAVQGNTTFTCAAGTGNLTGGGNTITMGTGGSCNAITTSNAVSFTTSVTTPLLTNSGPLAIETQATIGSDDIVFSTAGTEKARILENGNLLFEKGTDDVTFAVTVPSGAPATYTFSGATGTVLTTANYTASLDATYVNVGETPAAGDIAGSFSGGFNINAGVVTNAKLQNSSFSTSFGTNLSGSASISLGGTLSVSMSTTPTFTSVSATTFSGALTGNASTATSLAANPTDCAANQFANAIDAEGDLSCAAVTDADVPDTLTIGASSTVADAALSANITKLGNTIDLATAEVSGYLRASNLQGAGADLGAANVNIDLSNTNGSFVTNLTVDGSISAGIFAGNLTGNASTATALAADPTDCTANTFATVIGANGNLTCSAVGKSALSNSGTLGFTWSDSEVADTLTASLFVGTGSTTSAIDLATAEVAGILGVANGGTGVNGSAASNGQLLIGNGTGYSLGTLGAGNGISITNGAGTISVSAIIQANKGLEVDGSGLSLIDCATGEVLKYNGSNQWACAADNGTGSAPTLDDTYGNDPNGSNAVINLTSTDGAFIIRDNATTIGGTLFAIQNSAGGTSYLDVTTSGISTSGMINGLSVSAGTITGGVWNGTALADAYVSDTLTASIFAGSGSTTNAIDLATAEVAGNLPANNLQSAAADLGAANVNIDFSNTNAGGFVTNLATDGTVTAATFIGALTGNASTATALSADPSDCAANQFATAIAASGNLSCAAITDADVPDTITISALGSVADGALSGNVTLAGNTFNGNSQLVQTTTAGLLPSLNGSLVSNVDAALLGGQPGSYYLDLTNATGTLAVARIADGTVTNAKLQNSSFSTSYGTNLSGSASVSLGGTLSVSMSTTPTFTSVSATTFTGALTGNASTATALAADPTDCAANTFANTIAANGNLTCSSIGKSALANSGTLGFSWSDAEISDTLTASILIGSGSTTNAVDLATAEVAGNLRASSLQNAGADLGAANVNIDLSNTNAGGFVTNLTVDGTVTAATFIGALSGNATTATALATDPTDCAANQFATAIAASGNLSCASITDADVPNSITIDLATNATNATNLIGSGSTTNAVDLATAEVAGILSVANGGTGASTLNDLIVLGTHTTGSYMSALGTLTGLSTTGNSGEGSSPTLAVIYGSTANTAVQGNTTFTCASGTGNLTGGGNTITMGSGGTCNTISTNNAVSFSTSVTSPLIQSAGVITIGTTATVGSDDIVFNTAGTEKLRILENGNLSVANSWTIDMNNAAARTLTVTNSGSGVAGLSVEGGATFGANLAVTAGGITVTGNSTVTGTLSGLTGLTVASGGASISGGLNNNSGGITNAGSIAGATTISASGNINTTAAYQQNGTSGITLDCAANQFMGNATASGGILTAGTCENDDTGISDERLKENIQSVDDVLAAMRSVRIVNFNFKCSDPEFAAMDLRCDDQTGVIAQELEQVFPELVVEGEDGFKRVRYQALNMYTLKAVTELTVMVDDLMQLKDRVQTLEDKVAVLEAHTGETSPSGQVTIDDLVAGQLSVTMNIFTEGMMTVAGSAEFRGDTFFQNLVTFGGTVSFNGEVGFNNNVSFASNTGGYAVMGVGQQGVQVSFASPYDQPPIVSVSLGNGKFTRYSYQNVTSEGFDIVLETPAVESLNFSWIALSVSNPNTYTQ